MPNRSFLLKERLVSVIDLIRSVPHDWDYIHGSMETKFRDAATDAILHFSSYAAPMITVERQKDEEVRATSSRRENALRQVLLEGMRPRIVKFDEAGLMGPLSFSLLQEFAVYYARYSYSGILHFNKGHIRDESFEIDARCSVFFKDDLYTVSFSFDEERHAPAVQPILDEVKKLGLEERQLASA